jgi:hypothetical protein
MWYSIATEVVFNLSAVLVSVLFQHHVVKRVALLPSKESDEQEGRQLQKPKSERRKKKNVAQQSFYHGLCQNAFTNMPG